MIVSDAAAMSGGAAAQYFSLRWNNHPVNLVSVFTGLYQVGFTLSHFHFQTFAFTLSPSHFL